MKSILLFNFLTISILFVNCSTTKEIDNISGSTRPKGIVSNNQEDDNFNKSLDDLTNQIVTSLSEEKKARLAILEFVNLQGKSTDLGRFIAEELISRLYKTKKFYVIERQLLNKILEEHNLTATGLIDETSAKQLGKLLGVDAIASGTITELTNSVKVNSRLFSTETGSIFAVASTEINKSDDVKKLIGFSNPETNDVKIIKKSDNLFYKEDFSEVNDGMLPKDWIGGEKLCVKSDGRKKYLAEFASANHKVVINNVKFPENFEIKVIFQFASNAGGNSLFLFIGNIRIMIDVWGKYKLNDSYVDKGTRHGGQIVQAVLQKTGDVFKLMINNEEVLTARYSNFKIPVGFSFEFHNMRSFKLFSIEGFIL